MQKTIFHQQSVLDVTLQYTGSINKLFDMALQNDFSITQELEAGSYCSTPSIDDKKLSDYFAAKALILSTAVSQDDLFIPDPEAPVIPPTFGFGFAQYDQDTTLPESVQVILHNQSVFDVSLQYTGGINKMFDLAMQNDFSITQTLEAGDLCRTPSVDDEVIFGHFAAKAIIPATAITVDEIDLFDKFGIGTMIIETNFIVA